MVESEQVAPVDAGLGGRSSLAEELRETRQRLAAAGRGLAPGFDGHLDPRSGVRRFPDQARARLRSEDPR